MDESISLSFSLAPSTFIHVLKISFQICFWNFDCMVDDRASFKHLAADISHYIRTGVPVFAANYCPCADVCNIVISIFIIIVAIVRISHND